MSVTAVPVLARILAERGLNRTRLGGIALCSAAVADILAWSMLAMVLAVVGRDGQEPWRLVLLPGYGAVMLWAVRPVLRHLEDRGRFRDRGSALTVVLTGLLLFSVATEWLGLHFLFGAFLFGAVLPRGAGEHLCRTATQGTRQVTLILLLAAYFLLAAAMAGLVLSRLLRPGSAEEQPCSDETAAPGEPLLARRVTAFKGPLAVAPIFLEHNRRITALITVICLALLVFCLIERQVRQALGAEQTMRGLYPDNRRVRPTGRMILYHLDGLMLGPGTATDPPSSSSARESKHTCSNSSASTKPDPAGWRPDIPMCEVATAERMSEFVSKERRNSGCWSYWHAGWSSRGVLGSHWTPGTSTVFA